MSENPELKFCLDTSVLVEPSRRFYPFDFASSYWDWLASLGGKTWISVWEVYEEIVEGEYEDDLKRWVKEHREFFRELDEGAQIAFREISEYVRRNYKPEKADEFFTRPNGKDNADPYVIAMAKAKRLTVITFETPTGNINSTRNPEDGKYNTKVKIPDVCIALGVDYNSLFYMMRFHGINLHVTEE